MTITALFAGQELSGYLRKQLLKALGEVSEVAPAEIRADGEAAAAALIEKHTLEPVVFDFDNMERSATVETTLPINTFRGQSPASATGFYYTIPVIGTSDLLYYKASQFVLSGTPRGEIGRHMNGRSSVKILIASPTLTASFVKEELDRIEKQLTNLASYSNSDLVNWNGELKQAIVAAVFKRKQLLDSAAAIADELDA
jgi:hypothetical protein